MQESINEMIRVEVSKDRMLGVIWFEEPTGDGIRLLEGDIRRAIRDKGIIEGIHEDIINQIVTDRKYNFKYIIAQGKKAIDGEDGVLTFHFDVNRINHFIPKLNEDGTVDFKDLGAVFNVTKGQILASRTLSTDGVPGYNVLGQVIKPRKGKPVRMPRGKNTELLEDDKTLVASLEGKLEYDGYNVYVNTVYILSGDLDSSVGNINCLGSVIINGTVHSGFVIEAKGSVEVRGPVDDAVIIAGGDIMLSYGIQGNEKSKLVSGGNVIAKFIQNACVEAAKDIVTEAILHSTVTAGDSIKVESGKGTIVGGNVSAANIIIARSIGSPMGTVTSIQIGVDPSIYQEHKNLGLELKCKQEELAKVEKSIQFLTAKAKEEGLDNNRKMMLHKLSMTKGPLVEETQEIRFKFKTLTDRLRNVQDGIIKVREAIYPGVKFTFGNTIKYIDEKQMGCSIRKQDGDVHISY